ncbi:MAG: sigma-70 family RNA polymerase sigma factor [Ruminococcaceae bacterium]|nr:sigma-70 family RNA polymerase sigma factor [Oscillospiraceae bacterium]
MKGRCDLMGIFFKDKQKNHPEGLPEDTLLAYEAADGNDNAFETLVRKYERLVTTCVYSIVGNPDDTSDVSQETFLKVYKSLSSFKGDSEFSTWLYRIAKNTALDFVRRRKQNTLSIDSSGEEGEGFELPDNNINSSPEKKALENERKEKLYQALAALSDEHREIIILRDLNGYSYEDIADKLEIESGTVKSRISRAREALRKILLKENYF